MPERPDTVAAVDAEALQQDALGADREHLGRRVDADHVHPRARGRDRDPAGADAELDDLAARLERLLDVERDVLDDARAPRVVEPRDPIVDAQGFRATQTISSDSSVYGSRSKPP